MNGLKEKVKEVIRNSYPNAIIDLELDVRGYLSGSIADDAFRNEEFTISEERIRDLIRNSSLSPDEKNKIVVLFTETPEERIARFTGSKPRQVKYQENYWLHTTPYDSNYWLFVDVIKDESGYRSIFVTFNVDESFSKWLEFVYPTDVIEFMGLVGNEPYLELFERTFENGETEIKFDIMMKHNKLMEETGQYRNKYEYVYYDWHIHAIPPKKVLFNKKEIAFIRERLLVNGSLKLYSISNSLEKIAHISELINQVGDPSE